MRFFEFTNKNFETYALIGASDINEAIDNYKEYIGEVIDWEIPEEITEEEALNKLLEVCDTEEEKQIATEEFCIFPDDEPYLILVDPDLDI